MGERTCSVDDALLHLGAGGERELLLAAGEHAAHCQHIGQVREAQLVRARRLHRCRHLHTASLSATAHTLVG